MHIIIPLFMLSLSIIFLWKGANWLVESASKLAKKMGVSPLVVGLTVVAFGTSAPEFATSIQASLKGNSEIAVGNIFGSNIFNLGFILGLGAIIFPLTTNKETVYTSGFFLLFGAISFYIMCFGISFMGFSAGDLTLECSVAMIVLLIAYIVLLYFRRKNNLPEDQEEGDFQSQDYFWLFFGLICIILGGYFLVENAVKLGQLAGLSNWIIGITIIAIGTSAPELVTTLASLLQKKESLAVGNLLGSDIFNLLGVIGVVGIISGGITVSETVHFSLVVLIANLLLVLVFLRSSWRLGRVEGAILIFVSILRYYLDFSPIF